jgi:CheY-like chemotaxis protein
MNTAENRDLPTTPEPGREIGPSASSIAHDIEVALAPIALYADALLEHEPLGERARHHLLSIRRAVGDVARNTGRLKDLDRTQDRDSQTSDSRRSLIAATPVRSLRVLLIDDDPTLIESLRSSLADEGHKVATSNGGQAGIDSFRAAHASKMPFDIVITDLAMPDVDGHAVVASLRAIEPATPIILLTGWRHQLSEGIERQLKVDRLLGKPPRIRELRAALAELTGRRVAEFPG